MKITRRVALASLLVLAVAVVLGSPGPASAIPRDGPKTVQSKLYPAADSPFPHAWGTITGYLSSRYLPNYDAVDISVSKLAPNASYYMPVTVHSYYNWEWHDDVYNVPIQTDARGNGEGWWAVGGGDDSILPSCDVYDASGTLVLTWSR